MYIKNFFKHIFLVFRHKHGVFKNCLKCGLVFQGITHDLSKFSPTELFESVKYYNGHRSPIGVCREINGYSKAWLHHKGRNKHHMEYWQDGDCKEHPVMPYKYAVECICDKIAATKTYLGKDYDDSKPLVHWEKYGRFAPANEKTLKFIDTAFRDLEALGEKAVLNKKYLKENYERICK